MKKKSNVGLVHGVFDLVHVGHILHFEEAKKKVKKLIASVTSDRFVNKAPGKPIFKQTYRLNFLKSLKFFDDVILSDNPTAVQSIKKIKPNIYFKGYDYVKNKDLTRNLKKEINEVKRYGGCVFYTNTPIFSSSHIINQHLDFISNDVKEFLKKIDIAKFKKKLFSLKKLNTQVANIGDPIIDIYKYVLTSGKANKSSIISTQFLEKKEYGGGTILIAKLLGFFFVKSISIFSLNTISKRKILKFLDKKNIKFIQNDNNLISKTRYIEKYTNQKMFQTTENENNELGEVEMERTKKIIEKELKKNKYVLLYDYGYIYKEIFDLKIQKKFKHKLIINCQSNSYNFGFNLASKYQYALILCMDELEFRLTFQNRKDPVEKILKNNLKYFKNIKYLIITCGKNGCYAVFKNKIYFAPTIFKNISDATGCGDIFLGVFSVLMISKKFSIKEMMMASHIAAGMHGNQNGNENIVNLENLKKICDNILK